MENTTGFFCKVAAAVLFILAAIAGIAAGIFAWSWTAALLWWGIGLFAGMVLYAIGEIVHLLTHMAYHIELVALSSKRSDGQDEPIKNGWTCSKCGTVNHPYIVECRVCKENKFS